jgi:hypothetical protein
LIQTTKQNADSLEELRIQITDLMKRIISPLHDLWDVESTQEFKLRIDDLMRNVTTP